MSEARVVELALADVGEGLAEAEIVEWLVHAGDAVRADQPVVTVMTDKAAVELPAPASGRVIECVGTPGSTVRVGSVLMRIERDAPATARDANASVSSDAAPQAAPSTRRRAAELGVDLRGVRGTGPGGRVLLDDIERHAARARTVGVATDAHGDDAVPLHGLRRATAEAVTTSWRTIPAMVEFREVDASALVRERAATRFTYLPFFVRAVAAALQQHPSFNATFDAERCAVRRHRAIGIGIATATDDGLIVPVLHHPARRTLEEIAAELDRLIARGALAAHRRERSRRRVGHRHELRQLRDDGRHPDRARRRIGHRRLRRGSRRRRRGRRRAGRPCGDDDHRRRGPPHERRT